MIQVNQMKFNVRSSSDKRIQSSQDVDLMFGFSRSFNIWERARLYITLLLAHLISSGFHRSLSPNKLLRQECQPRDVINYAKRRWIRNHKRRSDLTLSCIVFFHFLFLFFLSSRLFRVRHLFSKYMYIYIYIYIYSQL